MKKLLLISFLSCSIGVMSQQLTNSSSPSIDLKKLENVFKQNYTADRIKAENLSVKLNIPLLQKLPDGTLAEFYAFAANGQMLFNHTQNVGAGRTVSTNKVWPGGAIGTSLTGSGMTNRLGEWDGGAVLTTHQEFGGRVVQVDGATDLSDHATHVAGTLIAAGVDANAKGMSYQAPLKAYDWNFDESEMTAAASIGMLVSNHSYGTICGWRFNSTLQSYEWWGDPAVSQTEDYKFGFYDQQAADWDNIAASNPFYLICKSAGNDRGDNITGGTSHLVRDANQNWITSNTSRPADGGVLGYDCIASSATSKNILTVGAVNKIGSSNNNNGYVNTSSVVMSSFSGWGPTDDGRIKPDVVGAGVDMYSTGPASNSAYLAGYSGTSMASPNVAGSILLIQQHYNNIKKVFMRAASLKALVIHTADEAGSAAGPDYKFGWGLLNTAKAVQFITDSNFNQIAEQTLANGSTFTKNITSDGSTPLKVTLCWTDIAGTPTGIALDPANRMLVNDLDIRITRLSDNTIFQPYVLNPASPASNATQGDNTRDNVEQVFIAAPSAGAYSITVSHKASLFSNSPQNFSLIIGGILGKPSAAIEVNTNSICTNQSITYTDVSGGNPTSRVWYFPGGVPSTSTAANVSVSYATAGHYAVSLKVTNALGFDSIYKANFVHVGGLVLPFNETFEPNSTTLGNWEVNNPDNDSTWRLATVAGTTPGNTAACMPFYNNPAINTKDQLLSPVLSFKGFQNVSLSFKHAYTNYESGRTDSLIIAVSTNCGSTWTRLRSIGENGTNNFNTVPTNTNEFIPNASSEWCIANCNTINLFAYDGLDNVQIRFEGVNNYNNNLYIDNVAINGNALKPITKFGTMQTTACVGNPITFIDSSLNNPASWQWTFTGATITNVTSQNPSVIYNSPGVYSVKLRTTNSGGADSLTKTNYITVLPSPNIPNISSGSKTGICLGDSIQLFTDSVSNSYQWFINNNLANGVVGNSIFAKNAGSYHVRLIGNNGCGRSSTQIALSESAKPSPPAITTNLTSGAFCAGGTATITSNLTNGNQWYKNNTIIVGATNKTYASQDSGTFTVVASTNGCQSNFSNAITLSIKPKPVTSAISGEVNAKFNTIETYTVNTTAGSTYNWTITNGTKINSPISGSVDVNWGMQGTGNVSVKETASNGCIADAKNLAISLTPNTGIAKTTNLNNVLVYPNPMNDELMINFNGFASKNITVKLVNIVGQTVTEDLIETTGNSDYRIDVSKLNAGIYFIEITNANASKQVKLIKK